MLWLPEVARGRKTRLEDVKGRAQGITGTFFSPWRRWRRHVKPRLSDSGAASQAPKHWHPSIGPWRYEVQGSDLSALSIAPLTLLVLLVLALRNLPQLFYLLIASLVICELLHKQHMNSQRIYEIEFFVYN
jgi:hypothetical protein